jgi:hypothetical protein
VKHPIIGWGQVDQSLELLPGVLFDELNAEDAPLTAVDVTVPD